MKARVLLADDHAVLRDGLRLLLEAAGDMTVVGSAANGREAIRLAQQLKPEVVIMDLSMPELGGIEATRQIFETCPATQVIILSVHSTAEHVFRALRAGAKGYLLKESAGEEVVLAVRSVRSGRRYFSPTISEVMVQDYVLHRLSVEARSPLESLSAREQEILQLLVEGNSNQAIASALFLSVKTVESYRSRMMQKLGIKDLPSLVRFAIQHGPTPLEGYPE